MNKVKVSVFVLFFITFSIFSQEKKYTSYKAEKGETIQSLSRKFAITPYSLLQLNPDIKNGIEENQLIIVPNKKYDPTQEKEHQDYVKDGFLYHKVKSKENYYRLKKTYKVSKRTLRKHNNFLKFGDLKAGAIVKIPVKSSFNLPTTEVVITDTKYYIVKPKETKYKISRRYGITVEKLEELNPDIKESGLKMAQVIRVPNVEEIPDTNEDILEHQIEKGETMFSLSQKFEVSQGQLLEMNPQLKDGVKEGVLIQIPKSSFSKNTSNFVANIQNNRSLDIVMMLPFLGNKPTIDFEKDRAINIVTDFYLGALIALDSVKKMGLSVHMKVFDTQNSIAAISTILKTNNFDNVDAIIGPMYVKNVEFLSKGFHANSLALISPVSSKKHSNIILDNLVVQTPLKENLQQQSYAKVLNFIKKKYTGQHLIVIADDLKENEAKVNNLVAQLQQLDTLAKVQVLKPKKGYIKPDLYRKALDKEKENWAFLITDDGVVTVDAINNFGVLPEKVKLTLFSLQYHKRNFMKVNNEYLARLNFYYPSVNFEDTANLNTQIFANKYKAKYFVAPSDYAYKGFDVTYDTLLRLGTYSDVFAAFNSGVSERTTCKFQYNKNGNGFVNTGIFLIKYDGLNLVKVE